MNTVARLMRTHGIAAKTKRKFRVTTDSNHDRPVADDVVNRQFQPQEADRTWTGDITYIATGEGWLYLAAVEDLYSKRIVGGPLLAEGLYFNGDGRLEGRIAVPGRAPLVAVSTGFGLVVTWFTLAFTRLVRQASAWPTTRGRIVAVDVEGFRDRHDVDSVRRRGRIRQKPVVLYSYEVNGRSYSVDRSTLGIVVSASFPGLARRAAVRYPVGTEVDVHYDPLSPGECESVLYPRSRLHYMMWVAAALMFAFAWALTSGNLG